MRNLPSRRVFLRGAALSAVGIGVGPSGLLSSLAGAAAPAGSAVLVHIFLRGGADGLAMVSPYGEPGFYDQRGEVALPPPRRPGGLVALDDHFALHPGLAPLHPVFAEGRLAIVHAAGHYGVSRSHFSAQDYVELGTPGVLTTPTGTMGRLAASLAGEGAAKLVAFSTRTPVSVLGPEEALVSVELNAFRLRAKNWPIEAANGIRSMYAETPLHDVASGIFQAIDQLRGAAGEHENPQHGAAYPDTMLGNSLRQAAQLIRAEIGTRCIFVDGGGNFDTHSGQLAANATDFASLGAALAAFDTDLGKKIDDVVVMVTTEFGRTVFANGSHGTDHGSGYCALILGGKVRGGSIRGTWPGLAPHQLFEERDLAVTTDFRDLFAEVAWKHLGVPRSAALFPGYSPGAGVGLLD